MNHSSRKSSIHHHLTRTISKKADSPQPKSADESTPKVESGFGPLQIGTDVLSVKAAYKPIFRF